tara:strand:- start:3596 stop:4528 length:933 start_codon:yes stop_codon:yes gene_type:complete
MNIQHFQQLPYDIHYHIINQMESNNDLINFGKTNKTFQNLFNENVSKIKAELFRVKIKFDFDVDLNKHCQLCKKFKNLKHYFNENFFKFNIDRKTNHTIFDTTTIIYLNIFVDNLEEFNFKLLQFFKENNLCKSLFINKIMYQLYIYIDEDFIFKMKEDNLKFDRKDILVDNITNIRLSIIDLKLLGVDTNNFKFIDILEGINHITYEVKKIVRGNLELNNILVLDKSIVLEFLKENSLYYKEQKELVNSEILDELGQYNPDIEKVDNLVFLLKKKKKMMKYMNALQDYLLDNNIEKDNIPKYHLIKVGG